MACDTAPQRVHLRSATFSFNRCIACDRRLPTGNAGYDANFPLSTPECVVLICARVCALCLGDPGVAAAEGVRRMALAIFKHLGEWYASRTASSGASRQSRRLGCVRSRSHPGAPVSPKARPVWTETLPAGDTCGVCP